ncbi:PDZ domain-containing protein [Scytonema sp. PCC 10023]
MNQSNLGFKVNQERGVLIVAVDPNSAAAHGGLCPGDIITAVKGV